MCHPVEKPVVENLASPALSLALHLIQPLLALFLSQLTESRYLSLECFTVYLRRRLVWQKHHAVTVVVGNTRKRFRKRASNEGFRYFSLSLDHVRVRYFAIDLVM